MGDVESSVLDRTPHGGGAELLGDVERALAALKGSTAVSDRHPQTVEVMQLWIANAAMTNAKIAEVRAELDKPRGPSTPWAVEPSLRLRPDTVS